MGHDPLNPKNHQPSGAAIRLIRLLAVIAILLGVGVAFAYTGGWLSPHKVTPGRIVDTLEKLNGIHEGFRRNHAKGICVSGYFEANGKGIRLSKASVFAVGRTPVVGRFALAGGMPYVADTATTVRSMALRFSLAGGEEWRMGINNIPVFVVKTGEAFRDQMVAFAPDPATGKPEGAKVKAFLATHPETAAAITQIKAHPPAPGFASSTFNSLDAFIFTSADGVRTPVRWGMVSAQPAVPAATQPSGDANFLFDALIAAVDRGPLQWHLLVTIGQPGDSTSDPTVAWPAEREQIDVGTLTIDHIESEETSPVRTINFDPLVLPNGIAGSDDPILSARSAAYSQSFTRRVGEPVLPSAVTAREVTGREVNAAEGTK